MEGMMERWNDGRWAMGMVWMVMVVLSIIPTFHLSAQDYRAQAIRILRTVPLIDGHNDIPYALRERGGLDSVDFAVRQPKLMTEIPKLRAGHVGGQFWAAYVPVTTMDSGTHAAIYALEQIDLVHRLCAKYPRSLAMAYTAADIERNFAAGKTSCLIGVEGGHAIENSLGALRMFYRVGTRYMTLTHWRSIDWATASTDTARRGLSPFGREVVLEMNRLGMLVDLSHVNDQTMSDALHTTRAPVIFSHSSARALANHARNVPDSILKLVAVNRGVVMVNFNPGFVSEAVRVSDDTVNARLDRLRAAGADSATRRGRLRWTGLRLRRHYGSGGRSRGCVQVPRSDRRAAAAWLDRGGCEEGRGPECAAGTARCGTGRQGDADCQINGSAGCITARARRLATRRCATAPAVTGS